VCVGFATVSRLWWATTSRFTLCVYCCGAGAKAAAAAVGRPAGVRSAGMPVRTLVDSGVLSPSSHAAAPGSDCIEPAVRTRRRIQKRLWRSQIFL